MAACGSGGGNNYGDLGLGGTTEHDTPVQLLAPTGYRFTSIDGESFGFHAVATIAPVPEPTSLALLGLGGLGLLSFRRRGRQR